MPDGALIVLASGADATAAAVEGAHCTVGVRLHVPGTLHKQAEETGRILSLAKDDQFLWG